MAVDLLFGEYLRAVHPVVWMGRMIRWMERRAPRPPQGGPLAQLAFGGLMAVAVPATFAPGGWALIALSSRTPVLDVLVEVYLFKATFALGELGRSARFVHLELQHGNLPGARAGLRSLCSRDPSGLDPSDVVAGTVESLAENTSDSFVAPLLFFALFGVPEELAYRAVNTLDAIVGYHDRYEYLGKASARLDDLLNLLPARLTAGLLIVGGMLLGKEARRGIAIWRRDAALTESPNAGRPMAAMAGLLGVRLAKPGHYALGDAIDPLEPVRIADAWRVVKLAGALQVLIVAAILGGQRAL